MTIGFPRAEWNLPGYLESSFQTNPSLNLEPPGQENLLIKREYPLSFMETVRWLIWEDRQPADTLISKIAYWILGGDSNKEPSRKIQRSLNETPIDTYNEAEATGNLAIPCYTDLFPTADTPSTNMSAYDTDHPEFVAQRTYRPRKKTGYTFALRVALEPAVADGENDPHLPFAKSVSACYKRVIENHGIILQNNCLPDDVENARCFEGFNENDIPIYCDPNVLSAPRFDSIPVTPFVNDLDERLLFLYDGYLNIRFRFKFFAYSHSNNQTAFIPEGFTHSIPNDKCFTLLQNLFSVIIYSNNTCNSLYPTLDDISEPDLSKRTCYDPIHSEHWRTSPTTQSTTSTTTAITTHQTHSEPDWQGVVILVSAFTFHFFAVGVYILSRGAWKELETT